MTTAAPHRAAPAGRGEKERFAFEGIALMNRILWGIVGVSFGAAAIPLLLLAARGVLRGPGAWFSLGALLLAGLPCLWLCRYAFPPAESFIALEERGVRVKLGRIFDDVVPYANVASAAPGTHSWVGGYGVRAGLGGRMAVVTATKNIVVLTLREPQRMRVLPGFWMNVRELRVSAADSERFLARLGARPA